MRAMRGGAVPRRHAPALGAGRSRARRRERRLQRCPCPASAAAWRAERPGLAGAGVALQARRRANEARAQARRRAPLASAQGSGSGSGSGSAGVEEAAETSADEWKRALRRVSAVVLPLYASAFLEPLVNLAETATAGHLGGGGAVSALSLGALALVSPLFALALELSWDVSVALASSTAAAEEGDSRKVVRETLVVAVLAGAAVALVVQAVAGLCLWAAAPGSLARVAAVYTLVRAVQLPALLAANVSEGFLYGRGDSVTPMVIHLASSVLSIAALAALARFGLPGCAAAIVVASVGAAAIHWVLSAPKAGAVNRGSPSGPRKGLVTTGLWDEVLARGGLLAGISACKTAAYTSVAYAVATKGSAIHAAAYKIGAETYWCVSHFTEPVYLAASTLVPRAARRDAPPRRMRATLGALLGFACLSALLCAPAAGALVISGVLTSNGEVASLLRPAAALVALQVFVSSFTYALEGVLVGLGHVRYLAKTMAVQAGLVMCYSLWLALTKGGLLMGLVGCVLFQTLRLVSHAAMIARLRRRAKDDTASVFFAVA